jgi:predicted metal-dependent HD superfamily phosphohydrolase
MKPQQAIDHILSRLEKDLPETLYYHGRHHAVDVLESAKMIAKSENVTLEEINLLLVAAAYHDCGFLNKYKNHEEESCKIARGALPQFGFDDVSVVKVCEMIMATKVPQNPHSKLAEILCDADLDYLGTDRFKRTGDLLYDELIAIKAISDRKTWDHIQIKFLTAHRYYTKFSKENRQPTKELHIRGLKKTLGLS